MLPIITPIHLFTSIISTYVASKLFTDSFCINMSSVVFIGFCQSDECLPRVQLSIILHQGLNFSLPLPEPNLFLI